MRRDEPPIKFHALDHFQLVIHRLALGDCDRAGLPHALEGVCDHLADRRVPVRGYGGHLADFLRPRNRRGALLQVLQDGLDGCVDAPLHVHGVHAGDDSLRAFLEDGTGKHSGSGGSVARKVIGLRRHLLDQLGTEVWHLLLESDGLGNGDAVLRDLWCAEALLDHDVSALGPERHRHSVRKAIHALQHRSPGNGAMLDLLRSKTSRARGC
mmetsp:Transcript_26251/g.73441  ORF Transcript_26251/g.73441 Transcript_26251/m.73441 type:complete len:211 (-) Transcript_26251:127-759(-)